VVAMSSLNASVGVR